MNAYLHFMVCQGIKDFEITRSNERLDGFLLNEIYWRLVG